MARFIEITKAASGRLVTINVDQIQKVHRTPLHNWIFFKENGKEKEKECDYILIDMIDGTHIFADADNKENIKQLNSLPH